MPRKRILWQLYPTYLIILFISFVAIYWFGSGVIHDFWLEQVAEDLNIRTTLVSKQFAIHLNTADYQGVDSLSKEIGRIISTRITVILPDGRVIGDSEDEPAKMENHSGRPEVQSALKTGKGVSVRYSSTIHQRLMYLALPVMQSGEIALIVRTSVSIKTIDDALESIKTKMAIAGAIIAAIMAILSLFISRRISRPLEELKLGAEQFSRGELHHKLAVPESAEIGALAEAMNIMAEQLDRHIKILTRQRNEQEAILASMLEGVLAIDLQEKIISMNYAAGRMLKVDLISSHGRAIQEAIRVPELHKLIARTFAGTAQTDGELAISLVEDEYLQVRSALLKDSHGGKIGVLLVFNDITHLRKLENLRRDFVANVSHELKTPITNIKGYVETLLDGAIHHPEDSKKFLEIIEKHVDRLNAIINDLLLLSRMEKEAERFEIAREDKKLRDIIINSIQACDSKALDKKIEITHECNEAITALINAPLMEQVLINLLDNAVKYSDVGQKINIECQHNEAEIAISVIDNGCGIDKEHLPRIFERFYRVDPSRSRALGGTGLGLAIAKHIVLAHGGNIEVNSVLGKGSKFTIHLPLGKIFC
jgi:two-component system phosphate regulon sensor histidine kinase PhoR